MSLTLTPTQTTGLHSPEVMDLWRRYKISRTLADRDRLILHYLPLVRQVAAVVSRKLPRTVEVDDLAGWGTFGLIEAIDSFEVDRGIAFSGFARFRIRGAIMDELRRLDWLPRSVRDTQKQATRTALQAPANDDAVDPALKLSVTAAIPRFVPLADAFTMQVAATTTQIASSRMEMIDTRDHLLRGLCRTERLILILYYCEGLRMREVAQTLGISEGRVSQLCSQAVARLRESARKAA